MVKIADIIFWIGIGILTGVIVHVITKWDYSLIIAVVIIGLCIVVGYSVLTEPAIKITFPVSEEKIDWEIQFEGTYTNLKEKNLYLIHLPLKKDGDAKNLSLPYYNQDIPKKTRNNNGIFGKILDRGTWECSATVGLPDNSDENRNFEITAIITGKILEIKKPLPGIPEHDAIYKIMVTRK